MAMDMFEEMMRRVRADKNEPVPTKKLVPALKAAQRILDEGAQTFPIGTFVRKRKEIPDTDESCDSLCFRANLKYPHRDEVALVVGYCQPSAADRGEYRSETIVILTVVDDKLLRFATDPVYFEEVPADELK